MSHRSSRRFPVLVCLSVIVFLLATAYLVNEGLAENSWRRLTSKSPGQFYFKPAHTALESGQGRKIYLSESEKLPSTYMGDPGAKASLEGGQVQPSTLVSGDFDADGVADLVVGYSRDDGTKGGVLAIHRGNLDAFAPQSEESFRAIGRDEFPSPFLPNARAINVPVHPDFIAEGR